MAKYIERLKNKVKIKKFDSNQPIGAWIFVLLLNIVGFAGYLYLKVNQRPKNWSWIYDPRFTGHSPMGGGCEPAT